MTQKDAVFGVIVSTLNTNNISFQEGVTIVSSLLTKAMRISVMNKLVDLFKASDISVSDDAKAKLTNEIKLRAYVSGLISNWLTKDSRLNGGVKAVRPARSGTKSDPQLKAMKQLLSTQSDHKTRAEIQTFIDKRVAELA